MQETSTVTVAITVVTAAASLLSLIGSAFILICYAILPLKFHFRHVLILNLAISDFLNALNNSAAGLYILANNKGLEPGRACIFNGFVGQVTVQATDCTILAIAISTVLIITRRGAIPNAREGFGEKDQIFVLCFAIWALPFFTGFLALGMGWYSPASGNWCWIKEDPAYLRYVLTHGWRILFIIVEICLYVYLDRHIRRHYRTVAAAHSVDTLNAPQLASCEAQSYSALRFSAGGLPSAADGAELGKANADEKDDTRMTPEAARIKQNPSSFTPRFGRDHALVAIPLQQKEKPYRRTWSFMNITGLRGIDYISPFRPDAQYQIVRRVLLMNAYPLGYIILWIPGLANRLVEATGHSSKVMQLLQGLTQLVGLANALTYGWNERVAKQLKERFQARN
ncbi:hypothetical protein APHAL10511_008734 [Amanita phalloides]|nr:hypothetical protein APHAL10511_008734 [Amanita phalloides]